MYINPLGAGVSSQLPLVGGGISPPCLTSELWSEKCEVAIESPQRGDSNAILKLFKQGQMLGQGQGKGQSRLFSPYRLPRPDQRQLQAQTLRKCY